MGDLEQCEQSIEVLVTAANNTTSDSITSAVATTTCTSTPGYDHSSSDCKDMGAVVSRLNAAIFGPRPPRGIISQLLKHQNNRNAQKGPRSYNNDIQDVEANLEHEDRQLHTTDYTTINIPVDLEYESDTKEFPQNNTKPPAQTNKHMIETENAYNENETTMQSYNNTREAVSAENVNLGDEEAEGSGLEINGLERVDSDQEEDEEDEQIDAEECDSDEDMDEVEEESDFEVNMEHIDESDHEHYDLEESDTQEPEFDSEQEAISESDDGEIVEFTDDEDEHREEEETTESEEDELICDCDSNCPSDCDGDHHECSSQCDCHVEHSESDDETNQSNETNVGKQSYHEEGITLEEDNLSPLQETSPPIGIQNADLANVIHKRQASLPESSFLLLQANSLKQSQRTKKPERNNNKLVASQSMDLVNELQAAIDARVKRSTSCREVSTHRKLSNPHSHSGECKVEKTEREAWRKDRRARLRTLELKREQILDEVRDGTKDRVTEAMYSEVSV